MKTSREKFVVIPPTPRVESSSIPPRKASGRLPDENCVLEVVAQALVVPDVEGVAHEHGVRPQVVTPELESDGRARQGVAALVLEEAERTMLLASRGDEEHRTDGDDGRECV